MDLILEKYSKDIDTYEKKVKRIKSKSDDGIIKSNKENNSKVLNRHLLTYFLLSFFFNLCHYRE